MLINAKNLDHRGINDALRDTHDDCTIENCCGQRFIAAGMSDRHITIEGIPGNALGAFMNGGTVTVNGNAQDAVGDTMNEGDIIIHGSIGDAAGYAMRGGRIFVRGNAGYRAGIHMKAYEDKMPLLVIGGKAGSFLGEYQAGGVIIVLNLDTPEDRCVSNFPCTGMHGGKIFLRSDCRNIIFPEQVSTAPATDEDKAELRAHLNDYCAQFDLDLDTILAADFTVVTPNSSTPYRQMYVAN
ncbi:MAG: glutamate synthase [Lachnospiraceae bacterium]|nr:glutamate synthase [Lachnospiraceae bacterium]